MPALALPFPIRGVSRIAARDKVPELQTLDARNVVPYDAEEGRLRGGQRAGTQRAVAQKVAGTVARVQGVRQITLAEGAASGVSFVDGLADLGWGFTNIGLLAYSDFLSDFTLTAGTPNPSDPTEPEVSEVNGTPQVGFASPDVLSFPRDPLTFDTLNFPASDFEITIASQTLYEAVAWFYDNKDTFTTSLANGQFVDDDSDDDWEITSVTALRLNFSVAGNFDRQIFFERDTAAIRLWNGGAFFDTLFNSEAGVPDEVVKTKVGELLGSIPPQFLDEDDRGDRFDWPETKLTFTKTGASSWDVGMLVNGVDAEPGWEIFADDMQIELYDVTRKQVNVGNATNTPAVASQRRASFSPPVITLV